MTDSTAAPLASPKAGIVLILVGMFCISINDMLIKRLSGDYPLHQMVFIRSAIGIVFSLIILHFEGGWRLLKTRRPGLHFLRASLVFFANMTYFAALAVLPLASATALFFVAPLFITLLSIPVLGEKVGPRRLTAVIAGFLGVVVMTAPGADWGGVPRWALFLPVIAAAAYAGMQVLTRKLGVASKASAMAIYIQATFLFASFAIFLVAGDGRFADGVENDSLIFLLRAWTWPEPGDRWLFVLLGMMSAAIGYCLSQAYRLGDAATIAPYEYVALPLAVFWGWMIFGDLPGLRVASGIALIGGAGVYVFLRERHRNLPVMEKRPVRRY